MKAYTKTLLQKNTSRFSKIALFFGPVLFAGIVLMLVARHMGREWVIGWDDVRQLLTQPFVVDSFILGIFPIEVFTDTYYFEQHFQGADLSPKIWPSIIWIISIGLGLSLLITAISGIKRIAFLLTMTLVIILGVTLRIDLLGVLGFTNKVIAGVVVGLVILLAFYFHTFYKNGPILKKLLIAIISIGLLLTTVLLLARESFATLIMTNYGIIIPGIVSAAVIILVSTQIPYLFLYLTTRYTAITSKGSLVHFSVFMVVYMVNLVLLYFKNAKELELNIFYIDDYYLLAISLVAGWWGVRKNPIFQKIFPSHLFEIAYVGLSFITIATLTYALAQANDPLIAAFEDVITYSHISFGLIFFVYTIVNFREFKGPPLEVYENFYKDQSEKILPNYLARGMSFMIITLLLMRVDVLPLKQSLSGWYNGLGDIYLLKNETLFSELYYGKGVSYDPLNHRSSYAIATLAKKANSDVALLYWKQANLRDPSPQAYCNLAQVYLNQEVPSLAISTLQNGIKQFPDNSQLANNLGLIYLSIRLLDSTAYYLELAAQNAKEKEIVTANLYNYLLKNPSSNADSLEQTFENTEHLQLLTNQYALLDYYQQKSTKPLNLQVLPTINDTSKILDYGQFAYLHNYLLNPVADTTHVQLANTYIKNSTNQYEYGEALALAKSHTYFKNHKTLQGIEAVDNILGLSPLNYKHLQGVRFLQAGDLSKSIQYIAEAEQSNAIGKPTIKYHLAIALTEAQRWEEALQVWKQVLRDSVPSMQTLAQQAIRIISFNDKEISLDSLSDIEKFGIIYYQTFKQAPEAEKILSTILEPNYRIRAIASLMNYFLERNQVSEAERLYKALDPRQINSLAQSEINLAYLNVLVAKNDIATIQNNLPKVVLIPPYASQKLYFEALIADHTRKDYKIITQKYQQALDANPFDVRVYLAAQHFANQKLKNIDLAYNWLVTGVRLNENSLPLWQAYTIQALENGLFSFAEDGLREVKRLAPDTAYNEFETIYNTQKTLIEKKLFGQ